MTSVSSSRPTAHSTEASGPLQTIADAIDGMINSLFALKHSAAVMRGTLVWLSFAVIAVFLLVSSRSLDDWTNLLFNFLSAVLAPRAPLPNGETSTQAMLDFAGAVLGNPEVWAHLVALYAPYWLMSRIAAIYLADIFEKEENVARQFISQAAFGSEYNTVHIREGKIIEADQSSPIVQIGGPGYVMVELDSAALFERPDGSPHVIAPTVGEWRGKKVIEGFERIRQAAD